LLEHAEGVLDVEPAQESLPDPIDLSLIETGAGVSEPHGFRDRTGGQMLDLQPDRSVLDDRQDAVVTSPAMWCCPSFTDFCR